MADISKITLPSGSTYDIKDAIARDMISAGVSFIIAWDGASSPVADNIPKGVTVQYNSTSTTGTLEAATAVAGGFYLVKSSTTPSSEILDIYDEYTVIKPVAGDNTTWFWEKIGDTQLNLTNVVTNVTLNKQTDNVIGANSTFTVTQPTISLATGATAGAGVISVATDISSVTQPTINLASSGSSGTGKVGYIDDVNTTKISASASGAGVAWNSKDQVTVLTGVKVTAQPIVSLTANDSTDTGRLAYVQSLGSATSAKLSASASGGAVSASGDNVTALTGLGSPSTKSAIGANSTFTITQPTVSLATDASSATGRVQVATGDSSSSTTNTNFLKGISVSDETLIIGAATLNSTYVKASASGANTAWNSKDAVTAVTGYANTTSDTVLGTGSTFNVTNPTVTISSGTSGDVTVITSRGTVTTKYMSASASGTTVGADGTDTAIGSNSTFTVTQPSVTISSGSTGDVTVATGAGTIKYMGGSASGTTVTASTTNIKATATSGNVAWNSKDQKTVLNNTTSITVDKGQ